MVAPYQNAADAQQQLGGSVILYDGRPVYVVECFAGRGNDILMSVVNLPRKRDPYQVSIFDPLVEGRGVGLRLGYCNLGGDYGAVWLSRIPRRQYSQGLTRNNVAVNGARGRENRLPLNFDHITGMACFVDMMNGVYPAYADAVQQLNANRALPSVAFARDFCLERGQDDLGFFLLRYKNERVAWGDPAEFKLPKKFSYLTELLRKNGVPHVA